MGRLLGNKYSGENERKEFDQYFTPPEVVDACTDYFLWYIGNEAYPGSILDPCAGHGVWGNSLANKIVSSKLVGIDIDKSLEKPKGFDEWHNFDFIKGLESNNNQFDYIISNPPFKDSQRFVEVGMSYLREGGWMVYLLNESFLNSIGRYEDIFTSQWYRPEHVAISSRRVDFTGQGNPHTLVALFIWRLGKTVETTINWFDWKR